MHFAFAICRCTWNNLPWFWERSINHVLMTYQRSHCCRSKASIIWIPWCHKNDCIHRNTPQNVEKSNWVDTVAKCVKVLSSDHLTTWVTNTNDIDSSFINTEFFAVDFDWANTCTASTLCGRVITSHGSYIHFQCCIKTKEVVSIGSGKKQRKETLEHVFIYKCSLALHAYTGTSEWKKESSRNGKSPKVLMIQSGSIRIWAARGTTGTTFSKNVLQRKSKRVVAARRWILCNISECNT